MAIEDPKTKKRSFYGNQWEDAELYHSMKEVKRFRYVCKFCTKHKRTCPICASVI